MSVKPALLLPLLLAAPAAFAQQIVPADPVQFERVSLRQTVDDCAFDPERVDVTMQGDLITVLQTPRQCFAPGNPAVVDIQLGAFPVGEYRVEVRLDREQEPIARVDFEVTGLVQPAVFPPPAVPLDNYSGIWWYPQESGWGISLHQGRLNTLAGSLYVYDEGQDPVWYTIGSGMWQSSTRWTGVLFTSNGPAWSASTFSAAQVSHRVIGTITLDFGMVPGTEDTAQLSYTIDGTTVSKPISRIRF